MKKLCLFIATIIVLYSCNYIRGERVRGNGNLITQDRVVESFAGVKSSGSFDVYLTSGPQQIVRIEAEDNILPYIETRLDGDILSISTKDGIWLRPRRDMKIYITTPDLTSVQVNGSGNIISQNRINANDQLRLGISGSGDIKMDVQARGLSASIHGSGSVHLKGQATSFEGEIRGSGDIKAYDLKTSEARVDIGGSGSAEISAANKLDVDVAGSGDVRYRGTPNVSSNIKGSGSVTRKD